MRPLELAVGGAPRRSRRRDVDADRRIADFVIQLVSLRTQVSAEEIASLTRCDAEAARARQLAMYLANTVCAWPFARVGAAFGRDRTTASHASRRIEDLREDPRFDATVLHLEAALRTTLQEQAA
jgi:chromosomal replication initiation ATPase DnaA